MHAMLVQTENVMRVASFQLAGGEYGLDIASIQEIVRMTTVSQVPHAPSFLEGVAELRGQSVPVLDLRKRLGLAATEPTRATRIIVIELSGKTVGLIVDAVREVLHLSSVTIDPAPETVTGGRNAPYVKAIANFEDRLMTLLDLDQLLTQDELTALLDCGENS